MRKLFWVSIAALIGSLMIAACDSTTPALTPTSSEINVQGVVPSSSSLPVVCKTAGINCVEGWNGDPIVLYSGPGTGQTFFVDGATGNITTTGSIAVAVWQRAQIQTTINVTNTDTFTPTGQFQPLLATLEVTPTLSRSGFYTGTLLVLENTSGYTITVPVSPTNAVIIPFHGASLIFDGMYWVRK